MAMHKAIVLLSTVLLVSSAAVAKPRQALERPRPGAAADSQLLSPEAARLRQAQAMWPGRALCDDGGYRIRPCDLGDTPGGR